MTRKQEERAKFIRRSLKLVEQLEGIPLLDDGGLWLLSGTASAPTDPIALSVVLTDCPHVRVLRGCWERARSCASMSRASAAGTKPSVAWSSDATSRGSSVKGCPHFASSRWRTSRRGYLQRSSGSSGSPAYSNRQSLR